MNYANEIIDLHFCLSDLRAKVEELEHHLTWDEIVQQLREVSSATKPVVQHYESLSDTELINFLVRSINSLDKNAPLYSA